MKSADNRSYIKEPVFPVRVIKYLISGNRPDLPEKPPEDRKNRAAVSENVDLAD